MSTTRSRAAAPINPAAGGPRPPRSCSSSMPPASSLAYRPHCRPTPLPSGRPPAAHRPLAAILPLRAAPVLCWQGRPVFYLHFGNVDWAAFSRTTSVDSAAPLLLKPRANRCLRNHPPAHFLLLHHPAPPAAASSRRHPPSSSAFRQATFAGTSLNSSGHCGCACPPALRLRAAWYGRLWPLWT